MASLIRHTCFNLLGTVVPLVLAVITVPVLIRFAGAERFGFLALIWAVAGYAGLLDLGLSRAMARRVASGSTQNPAVSRSFVWRSVYRVLTIATIAAAGVLLLWQVFVAPTREVGLDREVIDASWCVAAMVPWIAATSVLRGVLEGSQRFGAVNLLRGSFTVIAYALLCLAAMVKPILPVLVGTMAVVRIADFLAHAWFVRSVLTGWGVSVDNEKSRSVWGESGWFLCSQFVAPFMMYMDRFLISFFVGLVFVAYYTVPYELATKLLFLPIALSSALFPRFAKASMSLESKAEAPGVSDFSVLCRTVAAIMFLPCATLMLLAGDLLHVWVKFEHGGPSHWVLVILASGVWFNSVAQIPFAWLQARGLVKRTVQLHFIELLPYLGLLALGLYYIGIVAAAAVWLLRAAVDLLGLLFLARKYGAPAFDEYRLLLKLSLALLATAVVSVFLSVYSGFFVRILVALFFVFSSGALLWRFVVPFVVREELRARVVSTFQRIAGGVNVG